jgi:hypothetical protein
MGTYEKSPGNLLVILFCIFLSQAVVDIQQLQFIIPVPVLFSTWVFVWLCICKIKFSDSNICYLRFGLFSFCVKFISS